MTYVHELIPGDVVRMDGADEPATFVVQTRHPLWPTLQMVVWRLADGSWSHDALSINQYVGTTLPTTPANRLSTLRTALTEGL